MPLPNFIKNIFAGGAGELVKNIGSVVDNLTLSNEEKEQLKIDLLMATNEHEEKMASLAQAETDSYLKDMDSARQMQISALSQGDSFSRRFVYYLTIGLLAVTIAYDLMFFWVQYPERNHDTVTMIAGVLNTGGLISIINFFYGSSKSSHNKQEILDKLK